MYLYDIVHKIAIAGYSAPGPPWSLISSSQMYQPGKLGLETGRW